MRSLVLAVALMSMACASPPAIPLRASPEIRCAQQGGSWMPIGGEAGTVIGYRCEVAPR